LWEALMTENVDATSSKKGCLKSCLIGCGILVLLGLGLTIGGPLLLMRPFQRAIDSRQELEQRFGTQGSYSPAIDGSIPAARIEAFLVVRSELADVCSEMTASFTQMKSMERFDDQDEVSKREVMFEALKTVRSALGLGPAMGSFFETRNQALLEAEMGLGEYTYIYAMAFHRQLQEENEFEEFLGEDPINFRVNDALIEMLKLQLLACRESAADSAVIDLLEAEIDALQDDYHRIPWQDGLPEPIAGSLAPFQTRLDESFCRAVTAIDLSINERHGVTIESR
jgi:hypothetical protein